MTRISVSGLDAAPLRVTGQRLPDAACAAANVTASQFTGPGRAVSSRKRPAAPRIPQVPCAAEAEGE
jgi:hypothetical protein